MLGKNVTQLITTNHIWHSRATVLHATSHRARQNSTLRNFVLLRPITTKLDVIDYVRNLY